MKILIGGSSSKLFHLKEFANALEELGIKTKVVLDVDYSDGYPSRKISNWIQKDKKFLKLIDEFKPNVIFVDRQRHFGLSAIKSKIPLIIHLRGDFWKEMKLAKETIYTSFLKRRALKEWWEIGNACFNGCNAIVPICKYLENKTKDEVLNKPTFVMYQGIDPSKWFYEKGFSLKHPCVGLLQGAVIWDKAKEMLLLEEVLKALPNVNFYWVGDGPFKEKIIAKLKRYENFHWLGSLEYPKKVRQYLSEIDVYALISGLDMSPLTLLEAQLMNKPVIATDVGGIPELMIDKKTGYLVKKGDSKEIIEKITELIRNKDLSKQMGVEGRNFVENNFDWNIIAKKFVKDLENLLK
ncbi:glycosyltransferase family 4 protein [Nitrosopumilus sp.]|uniref:glycosyltransferase family 4 protein n=1 Tax=Nitrosopumilus sp. TaxID=2024843 RepID=UPI003D13B5B8